MAHAAPDAKRRNFGQTPSLPTIDGNSGFCWGRSLSPLSVIGADGATVGGKRTGSFYAQATIKLPAIFLPIDVS